jgi:hypothetical protein
MCVCARARARVFVRVCVCLFVSVFVCEQLTRQVLFARQHLKQCVCVCACERSCLCLCVCVDSTYPTGTFWRDIKTSTSYILSIEHTFYL